MVSFYVCGLVFMPMAGALLSYGTGKKDKKARDYFVVGVAVLEFVLAVLCCFGIHRAV